MAALSEQGLVVPLIMLSGDTDATIHESLDRRGVPLLHKPIDPAALRRLVNEVAG